MPVQTLMQHGIHPDFAHYGLTRIIVAASLAEVMSPEDGALQSHDLAQKYCMDIQCNQS